jgi:Tfp pilus assembly protein PilV
MGIDRVIEEFREAGYLPAGPTCPTAPATPCPPYNYAFPAVTAQTTTALTIQNDWNADNVIQAGAVTDPISGAQRGEQVVYSFNAGQLRRQEIGIDAAPVVVAAGIIGLTYTYLDQNKAVTATAANIRTVTVTLTPSRARASRRSPWCTGCACGTARPREDLIMTHPATVMRDQRGVALPLALISLLILTMLVLTVLNLGAVEPQISRNLSDTARARHMAEAGTWAFDCLADQDLSSFFAGPDVSNTDDTKPTSVPGQAVAAQLDATFCPNSPPPGALPGLTTAAGTFAVTIRNDSLAAQGFYPGDQIVTGQPVDGGGKYVDTNGLVILTATGTFGTATRQVTAVIQRNTLAVNSAVSLPGLQADTYINGVTANQTIDGRDWTRTDTNGVPPTGTGPMRFGIATQPGIQANLGVTYESRAESAFNTGPSRTPSRASTKAAAS